MSGWFRPRPEPFRFGFGELEAMIQMAEAVYEELGDLVVDHSRARELVESTQFAGHAAARFRLDDSANAEQLSRLRAAVDDSLDELEEVLAWAKGQESDSRTAMAEWEHDHDEWVKAHNP